MTGRRPTPFEVMAAQAAERRDTGRPIGPGDLVHEPGRGFWEVVRAGNAGECAEADVEFAILAVRSERRGIERG